MSRYPLDILLVGDAPGALDAWLMFNLSWIEPASDRLFHVTAPAGGMALGEPIPLPGTPAEVAYAGPRATLLVSADWAGRADWRRALERADAIAAFDTATGRLLEAETSGGRAVHRDTTPARIAPHIAAWSSDPRLHGIACHRLPENFLWISPARAERVHVALRAAHSIDDALDIFRALDPGAPEPWLNLYLPDVVAYRIN